MLPLASLLLLAAAIGAGLLAAFAAHGLLRQRARAGMTARHLPRAGRIGVQLVAGVAIVLAAAGIFLEVPDNVIDRDEPFRVDAVVGSALEPLRGAAGLVVVRGVHFLTDVVGGFAAGATWVLLAIAALEGGRRWWRLDTARRQGAPVA